MTKQKLYRLPPSFECLLQSMFGWGTKIGSSTYLSDSEYKKVIGSILNELEKYLSDNVHTDPNHQEELQKAIKSAQLYFNEEYWWPGVFEGVVRLTLLLMGDFPRHEKYSRGKKDEDFYKLNLHRSVCWIQNSSQRMSMLYDAERLGKLDKKLWQLRKEFHENSKYKDFISWFREKYPTEYAKVF